MNTAATRNCTSDWANFLFFPYCWPAVHSTARKRRLLKHGKRKTERRYWNCRHANIPYVITYFKCSIYLNRYHVGNALIKETETFWDSLDPSLDPKSRRPAFKGRPKFQIRNVFTNSSYEQHELMQHCPATDLNVFLADIFPRSTQAMHSSTDTVQKQTEDKRCSRTELTVTAYFPQRMLIHLWTETSLRRNTSYWICDIIIGFNIKVYCVCAAERGNL
jgi:hypothetical protein